MDKELLPRYNEPTLEPASDYLPAVRAFSRESLGRVVNTRLHLERNLRVCGRAVPKQSLPVEEIAGKLLTTMLGEVDSPLSASLRARAAGMIGGVTVDKETISLLQRIALDEDDDLATRVNAVRSYLQLAGADAAGDLPELLESKTDLVRATAYVAALRSRHGAIRTEAEARFERQRSAFVDRFVKHRVPWARMGETTTPDDEQASRTGNR